MNSISSASVQIDTNGPNGPAGFTPLVTLRTLVASQINTAWDIKY